MEFVFEPEQQELQRTARRFLEAKSTPATVRELMSSQDGFDRQDWLELAKLDVLGLLTPTSLGGSEASMVEFSRVMEEAGRSLFGGPILSTALFAAQALGSVAGRSDEARNALSQVIEGSLVACLAFRDEGGFWQAANSTVDARPIGEQRFTLTGDCPHVLDGTAAELTLVVARTDTGPAIFVLNSDAPGMRRTRLDTLDQTRRQARLEFDSCEARLMTEPGNQTEVLLTRVAMMGTAALCAEQVGGAQRCLDMSLEYAKTRIQFGRQIGSFQAIKHKCADTLVAVELARTAAYHAVWSLATGDGNADLIVSMAKATCSTAFVKAASENIQIHGGIGCTWDHDAHLYLRRAKSSEVIFGTPAIHREHIATTLGL